MKFLKKTVFSHVFVFVLLILVSTMLRLQNLTSPMLDAYYFRQTQTATIARNFYKNGINLLRPELDIFGIGRERFLILESPLYEAAVALVSFLFDYSEVVARLVSITSGIISGIFLYFIVILLSGNRSLALLSLIFYLFFPINIFFQRAVLIESFVVMLHLLAILLWLIFLKKANIAKFIFTAVVTILAVIGKITYGPSLILFLLFLAIHKYKKMLLTRGEIWVFFIFVITVCFLWQKTANQLNVLSGQTFFTSNNLEHWIWNTGTISERLNPQSWINRYHDILSGITKITAVFFLVGLLKSLFQKKKLLNPWLIWMVIMAVYYLIFFRIQSHVYYFMIVTPSIAVLAAYGVFEFFLFIKKAINPVLSLTIILLLMLAFAFKSVKNVKGYFVIHTDVKHKIQMLNTYLKEPGPVIFIYPHWDWNSIYTYYSGRKGVVLTLSDLDNLTQYTSQGYRQVIFIDFSDKDINQTLLSKYRLTEIHRSQYIVITLFSGL